MKKIERIILIIVLFSSCIAFSDQEFYECLESKQLEYAAYNSYFDRLYHSIMFYKNNIGENEKVTLKGIIDKIQSIVKQDKIETIDKLVISNILEIMYICDNIFIDKVKIKDLNNLTEKILSNGFELKLLTYYEILPFLYIKKNEKTKAKELLIKLLKTINNDMISQNLIYKNIFLLNDENFSLAVFSYVFNSFLTKKCYGNNFNWYLLTLSYYKEYNGEKYDGEKIIDITNIMSMLSQEQLDQKIPPYYKKTFRQYAEELELFSINPIVDKKSNIKENENNFMSKVFIILGVLLVAILGGFLIKNSKKKKMKTLN